ncbi:M20 metallopeptidase family protein [Microbacterium sp. No. 7]|uniref:M20 metallopeptidase family protein n=1 Tax=Microbacterium sp. No. 7 TaxID=1714373 RepID=UPI0006ED0898|nr:M20 family metallopeptidase [Microbacterium sp. No. 7]ALJ20417.1 amidohydrolase [Microbacterium sp. No. 7]
MTFTREADRLLPDLIALRRRLHSTPEVGLELPSTRATVLDALEGLGLEVTLGTALSSVTAVLHGGAPGDTVLLRADMDALPITEETGLDFASANGAMHACGHDLHMAGLVGAARLLAARREALSGAVVFMFQPGEEGHDGARKMLGESLLDAAGDRPVAAYALHVDCTRPAGRFATRAGAVMASASGMRLVVSGDGGHAAWPHLGIDPVPVAAEIVLALQSFTARRVPATDPAIVSVVRIDGDSAAVNVIPARVEIDVNIRTLSSTTLDFVRVELPALASAIGHAHGCVVDAEFIDSYPVTNNDEHETELVLRALADLYGPSAVTRMAAPSMASEDFAYVLDEVPGTLAFLGARVEGPGAPAAMHSAGALFDEAVMARQAATLAELAWRRTAHGTVRSTVARSGAAVP